MVIFKGFEILVYDKKGSGKSDKMRGIFINSSTYYTGATLKYKKSNVKRKRKIPESPIKFNIESMDPLGQGVSILDKKPCFIPKTLPGEKGTASITKISKGVAFAQLEILDLTADNRTESKCEHFSQCPGCHYLHTDYENELNYKKKALQHHLNRLDVVSPELTVSPADKRFGYRNRMQLHYRHKYIGMVDGKTNKVIEIPKCLLLNEELKAVFSKLYKDKNWTEEHSGEGHCELFMNKDGDARVEWNQPYAHGGFSQVNATMNEVLRDVVVQAINGDGTSQNSKNLLLDLFSGNGNLSDKVTSNNPLVERVMIDYSPERVNLEELNFVHLDLYSETALRTFKARSETSSYDTFIVDPPRKGFINLSEWVETFNPKQIVYASCNASTMIRDVQKLVKKYKIKNVHLIDLFPGTYHYETLITLSIR